MSLRVRIGDTLSRSRDTIDYFALVKLLIVMAAVVIAAAGAVYMSRQPELSQRMLETGKAFFMSTTVSYVLFSVFSILGILHILLNLNFNMGGVFEATSQAVALAGGLGASYTFLGNWYLQTFFSSEGHQYFIGFTQSEMVLLLTLMIVLFAHMCKKAYKFCIEITGSILKKNTAEIADQ